MGFLPESSKSARKRMGGKKCYVESILVSNKGGGRNLCYDGGSRHHELKTSNSTNTAKKQHNKAMSVLIFVASHSRDRGSGHIRIWSRNRAIMCLLCFFLLYSKYPSRLTSRKANYKNIGPNKRATGHPKKKKSHFSRNPFRVRRHSLGE